MLDLNQIEKAGSILALRSTIEEKICLMISSLSEFKDKSVRTKEDFIKVIDGNYEIATQVCALIERVTLLTKNYG